MGIIKNGVSWRAFKVSAIFALGYYTNDALTPNRKKAKKLSKKWCFLERIRLHLISNVSMAEIKSICADAKSDREETRATLASVLAMKKELNNLLEEYAIRMVKVEETKKFFRDQLQLYKARMAEMEMKRDNGAVAGRN